MQSVHFTTEVRVMFRRSIVIGATLLAGSAAALGQLSFVEVGAAAGLDYIQNDGRAALAVGDYNRDGWEDVLLCGASGGTRLYRNNGNKTFTDVSATALPVDVLKGVMALFADLDNDGDDDIVFAREYQNDSNTGFYLYKNVGGVFVAGVVTPDLARDSTTVGGMAVGDADNDGDLDVVLAHYYGPQFYLRNDGIDNFVDATAAVGPEMSNIRGHFSVVMADFNRDGWLDMHTAVDANPDFHCRNDGAGGFSDVSVAAHTTQVGSDMGLAVGDIENDGDLDIYSTNINFAILYVNNGSDVFGSQANDRGVNSWGSGVDISIGWGTAFVDLDHDTDQDLMLVATGVKPGGLFVNDGAGYFTLGTAGTGLFLAGAGLTPLDYDHDGDVDLLVTKPSGKPRLFENVSPALTGRHWLHVEARGIVSNRDGVGAWIEAKVGATTMHRPILGGYSFVSGPPMDAHFGLGSASMIDELKITWPSGLVQTYTNVPTDQRILLLERECSGDIDGDQAVGGGDLSMLLAGWATNSGDGGYSLDADVNADGRVDNYDLQYVLDRYGTACQ
jgi:hypothetical protein